MPFKFQPIAFEALGGMNGPARYLIATIAKRVRDHSTDGAVRAGAKLNLTRTISCILARYAAELILVGVLIAVLSSYLFVHPFTVHTFTYYVFV